MTELGIQPPRLGTQHATIAPYGAYPAADGQEVLFSIQNGREWVALCERFLERPDLVDDPRFATGPDRVTHRDALNEIVAERFRRSDSQEVTKLLDAAGIANAGVNSEGHRSRRARISSTRSPAAVGIPGHQRGGPGLFGQRPHLVGTVGGVQGQQHHAEPGGGRVQHHQLPAVRQLGREHLTGPEALPVQGAGGPFGREQAVAPGPVAEPVLYRGARTAGGGPLQSFGERQKRGGRFRMPIVHEDPPSTAERNSRCLADRDSGPTRRRPSRWPARGRTRAREPRHARRARRSAEPVRRVRTHPSRKGTTP